MEHTFILTLKVQDVLILTAIRNKLNSVLYFYWQLSLIYIQGNGYNFVQIYPGKKIDDSFFCALLQLVF